MSSSTNSTQPLIRYPYFFLHWFMRVVPFTVALNVLLFVVHIFYIFYRRGKVISMSNLDIAFGDRKTYQEKKCITKASILCLAKSMISILYYAQHPSAIKSDMSFHHRGRLDKVLAQGKGAIILTAHLGNFPLLLFRLAQEGYKVNVIINPGRDSGVEQSLKEGSLKCGVNLISSIPSRPCVTQALSALKRNELLVIVPDQNFGGDQRTFVYFFEQLAATATSPVTFAKRCHSPIVPMFAVEDNGHWDIKMEDPIDIGRDDSKEALRAHTQQIIDVIQSYVERYPELYMWMHQRYKSVPTEKEKIELGI